MEGMMDTTLKSKNSQKASNIVKVLREQILTGMLKPGTRIMSARELSRHFQVSQVTANKALLQLVEDKLIVRNERSGSFVKKNWQAKNHTIGFADNLDVFGPEIQASCGLYRDTCIRMLYENNCSVRFLRKDEIPDAVLERDFDGILGYYAGWDDELMARMKKTGIPVVLGRFDFVLNTPFHQVLPDIYGAVYEVFHRIDRKQFDGLIIIYEDHDNCLYRRDIALKLAHCIGFEEENIELFKASHLEVEMNYPLWQDVSRRCRLGRKFIYTCGDNMASGLIRVFRESGVELGKEIQLASCGNLEDCGYRPFEEPTITGAGTIYEEYAMAAVRLLMRVLELPEENKFSQITRVPAVYKKRKTAF